MPTNEQWSMPVGHIPGGWSICCRVTAVDLATYVGTRDFVGDVLDAALLLVNKYVASHALWQRFYRQPWSTDPHEIPTPVVDRAVLETGAELYNRKSSKNGIAQFATGDSVSPMRISRDPLTAARGLLDPYLSTPVGIA